MLRKQGDIYKELGDEKYELGNLEDSLCEEIAKEYLDQGKRVRYISFIKDRDPDTAVFFKSFDNAEYHCHTYYGEIDIREGLTEKQEKYVENSFYLAERTDEERFDLLVCENLLDIPILSRTGNTTYEDIKGMLNRKKDLGIVLTGNYTGTIISKNLEDIYTTVLTDLKQEFSY